MSRTAAIFPAFGCAYLGNEQETLQELGADLDGLILRASDAPGFDPGAFEAGRDGSFRSELQSQFAVYLYGAAVSHLLDRHAVHPAYVAGYSMGIYAALHHAGSIGFETGLALIDRAYRAIDRASGGREFGTGAVSGLSRGDLQALISDSDDVEIVNENSGHSFLVSGLRGDVIAMLGRARQEGALHARLLPFGSPYHSRFMDRAAREFRDELDAFEMEDPRCPLVSTIDGRLVADAGEVRRDLADNINNAIDWHGAVARMIALGADTFVECGPGRSLSRMMRFIDPKVSVWNLHTLPSLLGNGVDTRAGALSR